MPNKPAGRKLSLRSPLDGEALRDMVAATVQSWNIPPPKPPEPGKLVPGEGVYVGQYSPNDLDGSSLCKTFNVYAALLDLPETMTYVDTVKHVAGLKDWYGFDGADFASSKEIFAALKDGSYTGGWVIPTRGIWTGMDVDFKITMRNGIFAHKHDGAFCGTFNSAVTRHGSALPGWYWSSTIDPAHPGYVKTALPLSGFDSKDRMNDLRLSCRLVRLVAVSAASSSA